MRDIMIIDMENFYVSSERVHDIKLRGVPVVVLSNNDGNPIARSQEAKALGIEMQVPWFKYKDLAKKHGIIAKSSNYALYADMSNRVMTILKRFSPDQEIYSIDECFLDFTTFKHKDLTKIGHEICKTIFKGVGLPVRVGIGPNKTLAKLANHCAKKRPEFNRVCNFNAMDTKTLDKILEETVIGDLWGVGRRMAPNLQALGIHTVLDMKRVSPKKMREQFSVVYEKMVLELNGQFCIELEEVPPPRKQIISSRSFGSPVTELAHLSEAVTSYMTIAAEKLRKQRSAAGSVHVFIQTNKFKPDQPSYSEGLTIPMPTATDDTRRLVTVVLWGLRRIFRPGFKYAKAGVMLSEIVPLEGVQTDLFSTVQTNQTSDKIMSLMDTINQKWGRSTIKLASEGTSKQWKMRSGNKSPSWTTKWEDLPKVYD